MSGVCGCVTRERPPNFLGGLVDHKPLFIGSGGAPRKSTAARPVRCSRASHHGMVMIMVCLCVVLSVCAASPNRWNLVPMTRVMYRARDGAR